MDTEIMVFDWIVAIGLGLLICLGAGVAITSAHSEDK
jgi:hypothetical protein